MTVIDSHVHVWDLDRATYDWLDEATPLLNRSIDLVEAEWELAAAHVDGVVLVQSADNPEDTANMFRVADAHRQVVGVVGWVPLDDARRTADLLDQYQVDERFVGVRSLIHNRLDPDWIVGVEADTGLSILEARGIPFDFVTSSPATLRHVPVIADRHPDLRIVLDHLGKPPIGGSTADIARWRGALLEIGAIEQVFAKVSGLYPPVGSEKQLVEVVKTAVEAFGASRMMFGGDWPISLLFGGYESTWGNLSMALDPLTVAERRQILGETAVRCYGLRVERLDAAPPR
ncbi:amidohydrolase family protein [Microbacterium sp. NPDC056234]|uniref:amidohydrolase family protein n=1 Tax=Microbacterium sp. NPDC056234 TaxID=3345757 RepID=UPI0035D756AF